MQKPPGLARGFHITTNGENHLFLFSGFFSRFFLSGFFSCFLSRFLLRHMFLLVKSFHGLWFLLTLSVHKLTDAVNKKNFACSIFASSKHFGGRMTAHLFLVSVLGCLSGHRIFSHLRSLRVIRAETLARARGFAIVIGILTIYGLREHLQMALALLLFLHFAPFFLMIYNQFSRQRAFRAQILAFLDELVLKMRAGRSLRESLKEIHANEAVLSPDLSEIPGLICFPEKNSAFPLLTEAQELLNELKKMDQSRVRVVEKLRAYRQKEKMIARFRQRSSQVTGQVRAQAFVCSLLYVGLLVWTIWSDPTQLFSMPVRISVSLYFLGMLGIVFVARSFRWKL